MPSPPSLASRRKVVDQFNAKHKPGAALWAYRGAVGENPIAVILRSPAELLSGHTPVAWVDGVSGCVALTHLKERQVEPAVGTPISELSGRPGEPGYERFRDIAASWGYD